MADPAAATTTTTAPADTTTTTTAAPATTTTATIAAPSPKWPDTWRQDIAGNDEKELAQLARYATPADVWKKARALEQRVTSGELRSVLPKDATPEQVAQWRTENGIPPSPDKYELKLREGLVIGEEDKPFVGKFLERMHGKNVNTEQASAIFEAYYDLLDEENGKAQAARAETEKKVEDALRGKWGNEYRDNQNRIQALLEANLPLDSKLKATLSASLKGNQELAELMENIARQIMPVTTLLPGAGGNIASAVEDEIAAIEKVMKEDRDRYNKDEKMQARWRELDDYRQRNKAKAA